MKDIETPKCDCWADDEARAEKQMATMAIAYSIGHMLGQGCAAASICKDGVPYVIDQAIINMLTIVAVANTAIETGSDEAKWETQRVLKGLEDRIGRLLELYYSESKRAGMTSEKAQAMRDMFFGQEETKQ